MKTEVKTYVFTARLFNLCVITGLKLLLLFLIPFMGLKGQDITIINPSFEGKLDTNMLPIGWHVVEGSPDRLPGGPFNLFSVNASDGDYFIGAIKTPSWQESLAQELKIPMKAGHNYQLSFDHAFVSLYSNFMYHGSIAIYGSNSLNKKTELLWRTREYKDSTWKRDTVLLSPKADYKYLIFAPYIRDTTELLKYQFSIMLLDNLSSKLTEVPVITFQSTNTCHGDSTGSIKLRVRGGSQPYTYKWEYVGESGPTVSGLKSGFYRVTVATASGTETTQIIYIGEYTISASAIVTQMNCYGDKNAMVKFEASGGISPYKYSLDDGASFQDSRVFRNVEVGHYKGVIRDSAGCRVTIDTLSVTQPDELKVTANVKQIPCATLSEGQVTLTANGGTPPYTYSIIGETGLQEEGMLKKVLGIGEYHYQVVDSHLCSADGDFSVTRQNGDCAVYMPTAFSPNGDGVNDVFRAIVHDNVKDFHMQVYGRWGQLIFDSVSPERGWDGLERGKPVPAGSYLWVVTYTDSHQQAIKQTGSLVVIR